MQTVEQIIEQERGLWALPDVAFEVLETHQGPYYASVLHAVTRPIGTKAVRPRTVRLAVSGRDEGNVGTILAHERLVPTKSMEEAPYHFGERVIARSILGESPGTIEYCDRFGFARVALDAGFVISVLTGDVRKEKAL